MTLDMKSYGIIILILSLSLVSSFSNAYADVGDLITIFDGEGSNNGGTIFATPRGIGVDSNFRIIVADVADSNLIQVYNSTGTFLFDFFEDTFASNPSGVAIDDEDNIIVIDYGTDFLKIYNSSGILIDSFEGNDGTIDGGVNFAFAFGVAVDNNNDRIIVADAGSDLVQVYEDDGTFIFGINGTNSELFDSPAGIIVDSNGRIIVADSGIGKVLIFDSNGTFEFEIDGTEVGATPFSNPSGVTVDDDDRIILVDYGTDLVQIFNSTGSFITSFDGGDGGGVDFVFTRAVAVDDNNNILVIDSNLLLVQIFEGFPLVEDEEEPDVIPPVITLTGDNPQTIELGDGYIELGATCIDDIDDDISGSIVIDATSVITTTIGAYQVTYDCADTANNSADQEIRTVDVVALDDPAGASLDFITSFNGTDAGGTLFEHPHSAAVNSDNEIIVVDLDLALIQIYDSTGSFLDSFNGSDGDGIAFVVPVAVAVDNTDRIIVADVGLSLIQIYDSTGSFITSFNGTDGGGVALDRPIAIAVDNENRIIVVDTDLALIQIYDSTGSFLDSFNGSDAVHIVDFDGRVTTDSTNRIIVTDIANADVQIFESDGTFVTRFNGAGGTVFSAPYGVAVDDDDRIIVGGTGLNLIQIYDSTGSFITSFNGAEAGGIEFDSPVEIVVDNTDRIIVVDSALARVQIFEGYTFVEPELDVTPPVITLEGVTPVQVFQNDPYVDAGATCDDETDGPLPVTVGGLSINTAVIGVYQVTYDCIDAANNSADQEIRTVDVVALDDPIDPSDFNLDFIFSFNGTSDDGSTPFTLPLGVAVDNNDRIIVTDGFEDIVQVFDSEGNFEFSFNGLDGGDGDEAFTTPHAIAVDSQNRIIVSDTTRNTVEIFNSTGFFMSEIIGPDGFGFQNVQGLAVDNTDRIIVADSDLSLVHVFNSEGDIDFSFDGSDEEGVSTLFFNPVGIAVDNNDSIIVADSDLSLVQVFDENGSFLFSIDGSDEEGVSTPFAILAAVAVDSQDRIYVADSDLGLVQIFDSTGTFLFSIDDTQVGATAFTSPVGLAVDNTDRIIVADVGQGLVQIFSEEDTDDDIVDDPADDLVDEGDESESERTGNGGCADCTPPTLGLNPYYIRVVDNGFSYNGNSTQVEKWHTPFPLITAYVNQTNTVQVIVYENGGVHNMALVQFGLGASEIGQPLNDLEVLIEVWLDPFGNNGDPDAIGDIAIEEIVIDDKDNLIDVTSVFAFAQIVKCQADSLDEKCLKVTLRYSYREATINNIMVVNVSDKARNTQNFFFNDGVEVVGVSLNEAPTYELFNRTLKQQKENLYLTLTRTDKVNHIWNDESGVEYLQISDDRFDRITPHTPTECTDPPLNEVNVPNRMNCNFRALTAFWN